MDTWTHAWRSVQMSQPPEPPSGWRSHPQALLPAWMLKSFGFALHMAIWSSATLGYTKRRSFPPKWVGLGQSPEMLLLSRHLAAPIDVSPR